MAAARAMLLLTVFGPALIGIGIAGLIERQRRKADREKGGK